MLSSAYLKNTNSLIENALAEENAGQIGIFYLDTKNEAVAKVAERVSFPNQPTKAAASSEIILHQVSEKVNLRVENQTQTKQFMQWFGDWRVNDQTTVQVATKEGSTRGLQHNADTGWDISVSGKVFSETRVHQSASSKKAYAYTQYLNDIVEKAVLLDSSTIGKTKSQNSLLMHSLYAIADIGNKPVLLRLYVEEMYNPNESKTSKRAYKLNYIEQQQPSVGGSSNNVTLASSQATAANVHTVSDLFALVKRCDKKFSPKAASQIVNEDGSPKIVYYKAEDAHGNIHLLDTENGGEAVYLNMRNPYRVKQKPNAQAEAQLIQYAKSEGYDGIIIPDSTSERYITFKQENIKSVDNVGTFDRGNAYIRYSVKKKAANAGRLSAEAELSGRTASGEDAFKEDKYYQRQLDQWEELRDGTRIKVGIVQENSALNKVGIPANSLYFDVGKIKKALDKHGDHLSATVLKQIPRLLSDPVVIAEYSGASNTVNVYGDLRIDNGTPVVVGIVMKLDRSGSNLISNIRTIHARSDFAKQITDDSVLYLNEDKKRTRAWFQVCGNLNVPLEGTKFGFIRSITYQDTKINRYSVKSRSAQSYESEIERLKKQRDEAKRQIKLSKYQQVSPAGIKRMAQDLLAEYRSTANAEELIDTLNKSDSFLNQTCFFNLRYTVRYMVEKLAAPPSRLEIGSARKTPLTPSPAKCGRRSVSGMTTMPFRKMEKKMA